MRNAHVVQAIGVAMELAIVPHMDHKATTRIVNLTDQHTDHHMGYPVVMPTDHHTKHMDAQLTDFQPTELKITPVK